MRAASITDLSDLSFPKCVGSGAVRQRVYGNDRSTPKSVSPSSSSSSSSRTSEPQKYPRYLCVLKTPCFRDQTETRLRFLFYFYDPVLSSNRAKLDKEQQQKKKGYNTNECRRRTIRRRPNHSEHSVTVQNNGNANGVQTISITNHSENVSTVLHRRI